MQTNNCALDVSYQKTAKKIFNILGTKIRFKSEEETDIIAFEFLGVIWDYNVVDIKQTSHYIDISCKKYIHHLCHSHGWEDNNNKIPS